MTCVPLPQLNRRCHTYVGAFAPSAEALSPMMQLKLEHMAGRLERPDVGDSLPGPSTVIS